jgi:hypothetical protein
MKWLKVESSVIKYVAYDHHTKALFVKLKNDAVYKYNLVEEDTFDQLVTASSAGNYFNRKIKPVHKFELVS